MIGEVKVGDAKLYDMGFRPVAEKRTETGLGLDIFGPEMTGKSRFALSAVTALPPDKLLAWLCLDVQNQGVMLGDAEAAGIDLSRVVYKNFLREYPADIDRTTFGAALVRRSEARTEGDRLLVERQVNTLTGAMAAQFLAWETAYRTACASPNVGAITVDTGTDVWETMRMGYFGRLEQVVPKLYAGPNAHMQDLVRLARGKTLIFIHRTKEEWRSDKPTGRMVRAGADALGYMMDAQLEFSVTPGKGKPSYMATFRAARRGALVGLPVDNPTFPIIAGLLK